MISERDLQKLTYFGFAYGMSTDKMIKHALGVGASPEDVRRLRESFEAQYPELAEYTQRPSEE